jgi:ubiquinone biosynthesis protein
MAPVNVVALDQRTAMRLVPLEPRPKVIRRVIALPGSSRMRRPEWEPTPLGPSSEHNRIEIVYAPLSIQSEVLLVAGAFLGLFFKLTWLRLRGKGSPGRAGREMRAVFERLGGFWMKVGQLMSLRRDVLPNALCDELAQLQHRAIGFSGQEAMRIVERELGVGIDDVFAQFDPEPFAAASLSQVHAARLRKGNKDVVVKVLRPGVRERLRRDMRLLQFMARLLNYLPNMRRIRLKDALGELEEILKEETDYRFEISNMRELRKTTRGHRIYIPRVYRKLSTSNIIVMEKISGVLMSDYIKMRDEEPQRVADWLKINNIKPKLVARRLLISFMRQLFENNLFHADLHPGNIILMRNSRIALIDLGSVGSLDREFLTLYRGLQRAMAEADFGKAADLQLRLCVQLPSRNMRELRADLVRCLRLWSARTKIPHLPFHERSVNNGAAEISRILYRYKAQQSWEFLKIARTLSTLDGSLAYLHRDLNYIKVLQRYFGQASQRGVLRTLKPSNLARSFGQMVATVNEYHLMLGPAMRSYAFNFEATVSKVARVWATVVKVLSFAVLVALAGLIYRTTLFHTHGGNSLIDTIVDDVPEFEFGWWLVMVAGGAVVLFATWRIVWDLMQPENDANKRQS